jgi:lysophospholipase L1-like esterase
MKEVRSFKVRDLQDRSPTQIEIEPQDVEARWNLVRSQIDRTLKKVLQPLGINYKFAIKPPRIQDPDSAFADRSQTIIQLPPELLAEPEYRITILCTAKTMWRCDLLALPLATALKQLNLVGCQEATIRFLDRVDRQARWKLRIDLTPPQILLRNWARWGDVQAITHLLNRELAPLQIKANTVLKNFALHIYCQLTPKAGQEHKFPPKQMALNSILPLIQVLMPQGIQAATIYGIQSQPDAGGQIQSSTIWTHWLDLPGATNPDYAPSPLQLAARGEKAALAFTIQRFLNPDLEEYLNSGGISIFLTRRGNLLHIMSEAIVAPLQSQVTIPIIRIVRQLELPWVRGVRIYGRTIGQKSISWSYGMDFEAEQYALPEQAQAQADGQIGISIDPQPPIASWIDKVAAGLTKTPLWQPQTASLIPIPPITKVFAVALAGCGLVAVLDRALPYALKLKSGVSPAITEAEQLDFNNTLLAQKINQYRQLCRTQGAPDILIVGSSRALRGVNPQVLRQDLARKGYPAAKVYNLGINGATAQVVDGILRQVLTPQQLPKLVIWVDGARAFNSGRSDRTYETIALSRSYRQLSLEKNPHKSLIQAQSSVKNLAQALDTSVDRSLLLLSGSYQNRDQVGGWLQTHAPRIPIERLSESTSPAAVADLPLSIKDSDVNREGFLSLDLRFDPTTYYQKYLKVTGDSDGDYANFQLTGNQDRATQEIAELLQSRKIPLVFVNAPLSDIYLDRFRRERESEFRQYMHDLEDNRQLVFVDLANSIPNQHHLFSDPSHLNNLGADALSRSIAQSEIVPWNVLR